jgi:ketosteroid isomerase-like protein
MTDQSIIAEIESLEARRRKALVDQDLAAIGAMMDDSLLYVHSSAVAEDKALYLKKLTDSHYLYSDLKSIRRDYRVLGDVVLANGDLQITARVGGTDKIIMSRYLQAWVRRPGGWKMVSWQSTPIPQS